MGRAGGRAEGEGNCTRRRQTCRRAVRRPNEFSYIIGRSLSLWQLRAGGDRCHSSRRAYCLSVECSTVRQFESSRVSARAEHMRRDTEAQGLRVLHNRWRTGGLRKERYEWQISRAEEYCKENERMECNYWRSQRVSRLLHCSSGAYRVAKRVTRSFNHQKHVMRAIGSLRFAMDDREQLSASKLTFVRDILYAAVRYTQNYTIRQLLR